MNIRSYNTLVFDCDGVVLDSNKVKTEAFYQSALPYGERAAQSLVNYHKDHGGISRYRKFALFLEEMVASGTEGPSLESLLAAYSKQVRVGLLHCPAAKGLEAMREASPKSRWLIVSGGDQQELRHVFRERSLDTLFDGGIFGSPDSKNEILKRECISGNIAAPALFLGDSRYDHLAASTAGIDFAFISQWTEFRGWCEYCSENNIRSFHSLQALSEQD
ncbi:MAG: HAD hydrolase-like protein [Ketobacteraceae bacterium]|nr:HAD hydrolase-like protein [Ketobacteraceae bacterium]